MRSGIPTFSAADSIGISPNDWKMNAIVLPAEQHPVLLAHRGHVLPADVTVPLVGRSSPPMMLSRVVLPEPDRPTSAIS